MTNKATLLAAVAAALASTAPAAAQAGPASPPFRTTGPFFGAGLTAVRTEFEDGNGPTNGIGAAIHAGYGVTSRLSFFAGGSIATMDSGDYSVAHVDVGARFLVLTGALRPYVHAAATGGLARTSVDDFNSKDVDVKGFGPSIGAGVEYGVSSTGAVDVSVAHSRVEFTEGRFDGGDWENLGQNSFGATSLRLKVGVTVRL